jgi:hypothetical protein
MRTVIPRHAGDPLLRAPAGEKTGDNAMMPGMLDVKGTKILAKSLFKELRGNGYSTNQILSLSTELIDLVTQDLKGAHEAAALQSALDGAEVRPNA